MWWEITHADQTIWVSLVHGHGEGLSSDETNWNQAACWGRTSQTTTTAAWTPCCTVHGDCHHTGPLKEGLLGLMQRLPLHTTPGTPAKSQPVCLVVEEDALALPAPGGLTVSFASLLLTLLTELTQATPLWPLQLIHDMLLAFQTTFSLTMIYVL